MVVFIQEELKVLKLWFGGGFREGECFCSRRLA